MGTWRSGWAAHEPHSRKHCSGFPQHDYLSTAIHSIKCSHIRRCLPCWCSAAQTAARGRPRATCPPPLRQDRSQHGCWVSATAAHASSSAYHNLPHCDTTAQTGMRPAASVAMKQKGTAHRCRQTGRTEWLVSCEPSPHLQPWPCHAPRAVHSADWVGVARGTCGWREIEGRNRVGLPHLASANAPQHTKHAPRLPKTKWHRPCPGSHGRLEVELHSSSGIEGGAVSYYNSPCPTGESPWGPDTRCPVRPAAQTRLPQCASPQSPQGLTCTMLRACR